MSFPFCHSEDLVRTLVYPFFRCAFGRLGCTIPSVEQWLGRGPISGFLGIPLWGTQGNFTSLESVMSLTFCHSEDLVRTLVYPFFRCAFGQLGCTIPSVEQWLGRGPISGFLGIPLWGTQGKFTSLESVMFLTSCQPRDLVRTLV
jgi:Na+/citrate or Na+/malate symporter